MPFYYKSHGKEPPNKLVAFVRRIYNPLGFKKGYNFPLWFIFAGAAFGFCLSRAMFLNYDGNFLPDRVVTGDAEYQTEGIGRTGMLMHLAAVIPIGLLLPWQFVPIIRRKFILFHRISGYLLLVLLFVGNAGAVIVTPYALGGVLEVRLMVGIMAIATSLSALLAWVNIKRLQIDQHRAWMLRCWFYSFFIVTQRIAYEPATQIVSDLGNFWTVMPCHTIDAINSAVAPNLAAYYYPECAESPYNRVPVNANLEPEPTADGLPPLHQIAAVYWMTFGISSMIAIVLHVLGVEIYLRLTGAEANRLKRVSRELQLKRGMNPPGDASWLTSEALGDMDEFDYKSPNGSTGVKAVSSENGTSQTPSMEGVEVVAEVKPAGAVSHT